MSTRKGVKSMKIGEKIKKLRQKAGHSQVQLSEMIGVSALTIVRAENGHFTPSLNTIRGVSRLYGISIDELVG